MPSSPYTTDPELNGVPAHAPSVARRFWHVGFRRRTQLCGEAFVLPTLLFFAVFKYWPMLLSLYTHLTLPTKA
jgi:hypothetical protein